VHQHGADDVAPDEGIQIRQGGFARNFFHFGRGRRYGERRASAVGCSCCCLLVFFADVAQQVKTPAVGVGVRPAY
jgi:hypothetical protein